MSMFRWALLRPVVTLFVTARVANGLRTPLYSTKTGYEDSFEVVGGLSRMLSWQELASELEEDPGYCRPVNIYVTYRHGTRYPSEDDIITYQSFLSRLRDSSINPEFDYLKDEPDDRFTVDKASELGEEGYNEMMRAAKRIKKRFPSLYEDAHSALMESSFQSTDTARTRDSAKGFINGLSNTTCVFDRYTEAKTKLEASCSMAGMDDVLTEITWSPSEGDTLLEAHDNCPNYNEFKDMKELDDEYTRFRSGPEVEEVKNNIENLLKGDDDFVVSVEEVNVLEKVCGMESALFGVSNWCTLFSSSDLRVIEYLEDLDEYWYASYGYPINYQPSCVLLGNISSYLQAAASPQNDLKTGVYKFAHSDTIQGLLALMNLFVPDEVPREDNYPVDNDWDYSAAIIAPFASNVAFTLFHCPVGDSDVISDDDDFNVLVTVNEQPIKVGPCGTFFCQYSALTSYLDSQSGVCNLEEICSNSLKFESSLMFLAVFYTLVQLITR